MSWDAEPGKYNVQDEGTNLCSEYQSIRVDWTWIHAMCEGDGGKS